MKIRRSKAWAAATAAALMGATVATTAGVGGTAGASAPAPWTPTATQALQLTNATEIGALPASTPLRLAVGLEVRNAAGLASFTREVNTPHSSQFGDYLTPAQFVADYAPTAAQVDAVTSYLTSQGLTNVAVTPNHLYVTADATAAQAEQAFNTSLGSFSQGGATVYANTAPAEVPTSLSGTVLSVLGLNDISGFSFPLQSRALTSPSATTNCTLNPTSGSPYGLCYYTPSGFRTAYATGSLTGAKTTIAIMAEGNLSGVVKDLRTAEAAFKEPQVPYTIEHVGVPSTDTSGADEWDLDTQYSTGMANTVKHLYIYDTTSLTDSDIGLEFSTWASQDLAKAASASFGECEALPYADGLMVTNDEVMNEAAAQGQTMHASSGDTGASCAVAPTNGVPESGPPQVNYPCSSAYIACVGGTSLFTNPNGTYSQELGWVAGGGGISAVEYSPYWQACVVPSNAAGDRGVPDVAMDADANTGAEVYVNGTPETVGGTSLSSPLALGAWAIIESAGGNKLGFASPLLYDLYPAAANCVNGVPHPPVAQLGTAADDPSYPLHDVNLGTNGVYPATNGWDYLTGLGTYEVANTAAALNHLCFG